MEKIVTEIIDTLKGFKEVEALAFGGSHAYGKADRYSDVDIYVYYTKKRATDPEREKKFKTLANFEEFFSWNHIDYFVYSGLHIHTWWVDLNDIKKKLKDGNHPGDRTVILDPKIIWDRGKLEMLRKSIKFSSGLQKKILTIDPVLKTCPKIFYDVMEKAIKRKRFYYAEWKIKFETDNIIRAIYTLNKRFYNGYPSLIEFDFKKFNIVPKNAMKNINTIGRLSVFENPEEKLNALFELYWNTIMLVKKKYFFEANKLFPEFEDRRWYKKRINEITAIVNKIK